MKRSFILSFFATIASYQAFSYYNKTKIHHKTQVLQKQQQKTLFKQTTVQLPFQWIQYPHYRILYSNYHKSPLAVHQILTKQISYGSAQRAKYFFPQDQIKNSLFKVTDQFYSKTKAYKRFNVNRGHMAAAGNYSGVQSQKFGTFTFANVIPQNGYNNGGIWNTFQRISRDLLLNQQCQSVEIISGPIFVKDIPKQQGKNSLNVNLTVLMQDGIPIAQKLYKIIKCNSKNKAYVGYYQFLNEQTYDNISLPQIQRQTGLNFNLKGQDIKNLDNTLFKKTKKDIDIVFFMNLMLKSQSIAQMNDARRRASEQKIYIQQHLLTDRIKQLVKNDLIQIKKKQTSCARFQSLLSLQKKLNSLKHRQQMFITYKNLIKDNFQQCQSQNNQFTKISKDYSEQIKYYQQSITNSQ